MESKFHKALKLGTTSADQELVGAKNVFKITMSIHKTQARPSFLPGWDSDPRPANCREYFQASQWSVDAYNPGHELGQKCD